MKTHFFIAGCLLVLFSLGCVQTAESYQYVRLNDGQLVTDYDKDGVYEPYLVKGVGYASVEIGYFYSEWGLCQYTGKDDQGQDQFDCPGMQDYENEAILDRDFPLIKDMNANTIRTWAKVTPQLLSKAKEQGLKVIAGYWINDMDFVHGNTAQLENDILDYVARYKDDPTVLMWGIGNECEIRFCSYQGAGADCDRDAQAAAFYNFLNDVAGQIHNLEGSDAHPVMYVSAVWGDIGEIADDTTLANLDVHGCNVYAGPEFDIEGVNFFTAYKQRSAKPLLITEFGLDAWHVLDENNPSNGVAREDLQAEYNVQSWKTILAYSMLNSGPALGGVVFDYVDGWFKHEDGSWGWSKASAIHDFDVDWYGCCGDHMVNHEWFGLMERAPSLTPGEIDVVIPRLAYEAMKEVYGEVSQDDPGEPGATPVPCGNGTLDEGEQCDGSNLNGQSCAALGLTGGTLSCHPAGSVDECTFDTSQCEYCGNGILNENEQCDGSDFGTYRCQLWGYEAGEMACSEDCRTDKSGCYSICGNGNAGKGEECDGNDLEGETCSSLGYSGGSLSCDSDCTFDESECYGESESSSSSTCGYVTEKLPWGWRRIYRCE